MILCYVRTYVHVCTLVWGIVATRLNRMFWGGIYVQSTTCSSLSILVPPWLNGLCFVGNVVASNCFYFIREDIMCVCVCVCVLSLIHI